MNENTDRRDDLSAGIIAALNKILPAVTDIRTHQSLSLEVLHARELCNRNFDNVGLMTGRTIWGQIFTFDLPRFW